MKIEPGQVAVVTGGTSGIGLALAAVLVRRGVNVMIADVREDAIPAAVDALSRHQGRVVGVHADVGVDADVDALADETIERFGRVDLVCNNAGVVSELTPMWEQRLETWRWLIDVKLMGVVHGVRSFAPLFIAHGSGHFLNTASAGTSLTMTSPRWCWERRTQRHPGAGCARRAAVPCPGREPGGPRWAPPAPSTSGTIRPSPESALLNRLQGSRSDDDTVDRRIVSSG